MHTFLAVTTLTLRDLIRRRIPVIMALFFLFMVYCIPSIVMGDGTVKGTFQLTLTYTLSFTGFVLIATNMFLSVQILRKEWRDKMLFVLDSKPASRYQILLGKFCGLSILNAFLILLIYIFTLINIGFMEERAEKETKDTTVVAAGNLRDAHATVLSSRAPLPPLLDDVTKGLLMRGRTTLAIKPNEWHHWKFLPATLPEGATSYTLRYKFYASTISDTYKMRARWVVGDPTKNGGFIRFSTSNSVNSFHEFSIPAELVTAGVPLHISLGNPNEKSLLIKVDKGIVVLIEDKTFEENLAMAFLIVFVLVSFIAATGIVLSTFISSPVSLLAVFVIYIMLLSGSITRDLSVNKPIIPEKDKQELSLASKGYNLYAQSLARVLMVVLPDYTALSPTVYISRGVSIDFSVLLGALAVVLRMGILLLIGCLVFASRELGIIRDIS